MKKACFSILLLLAFTIGHAQIGTNHYKKAEVFIASNLSKKYYRSWVNPHWNESQNLFWYSVKTKQGTEYIQVNLKNGKKKPLFSQKKLAELLSSKLNEEVKPFDLSISHLNLDEKGEYLSFQADTLCLKYHLKKQKLEEGEKPNKQRKLTSLSPDKKTLAMVIDYNIWLKNMETGDSIQVTKDGQREYAYGVMPSWYSVKNIENKEDFDLDLDLNWSPDGKYLIVGKYDHRNMKKLYLYKSLPENGHRAEVYEYERPIAGDSLVPTVEYGLIDMASSQYQTLDLEAIATFLSWGVQWHKEKSQAYFTRFSRGYKSLNIIELDALSAEVKSVYHDQEETYVDPGYHEMMLFEKSDDFLIFSERDGWNHIYHVSKKHSEPKQMTKGEFVVRSIEYIDEENKKVYFTAAGKEDNTDPYLPLFYVVNLDGSELQLLSPEKAFHSISLSPNKKFYIDNYSTVQEPNIALLRQLKDGKLISKIEEGDISEILAMGWYRPEPFVVKGRDGKTDIYGVIFKPANFDPNKSYPVIEGTYSGPQTIRTPKNFHRGLLNDDTPLTQLDFVLINIDGMGSAYRSKEFHDFSYKNLGDIGGPDKIVAMKSLAQKHPWMDVSRVGIFGHSAGGYDAAHALLAYPDFYKVGVATAGNHDHRSAKAWWPELYMGYPAGEEYDEQSNYTMAKNLKGNLLLAHGAMDQNVNPTASMRLAAELIKANKDFELILLPGKDHTSAYYDKYLTRKRWDFFVKHLHGVIPPKEYKIE